ncbi:hypothetical protein K350107B32_31980 [Agathobaculum butyriciproducens]
MILHNIYIYYYHAILICNIYTYYFTAKKSRYTIEKRISAFFSELCFSPACFLLLRNTVRAAD